MTEPPARQLKPVHGLGLAVLVVAAIAVALLRGPEPAAQRPAAGGQQAATSDRRPASTDDAPIPVANGAAIDDPSEEHEIRRTLAAMRHGPPYPFHADDGVWENREHRLPEHRLGFWHEYTVITPGEHDRSTRRIVAGDDGELWFTRDHYHTFVRLGLPDPRQASRN